MTTPLSGADDPAPSSSPLPPARPRVRPRAQQPTCLPSSHDAAPFRSAAAPAASAKPQPAPAEPVSIRQAETGKAYEVGFGRPPRKHQFKPGQSGNPAGRPKNAKGLKTLVRETLTQKVTVRAGDGVKKMTRMEALLHKTIELAMKGNPRALGELMRLYSGAVPDAAANAVWTAPEDLTATDLAALEALRLSWAGPSELAPASDGLQSCDSPLPASDAATDAGASGDGLPQQRGSASNPSSEPEGSHDWDRSL